MKHHEPDFDRIPDGIFTVMENFEVNKVVFGDVLLAGGAPRDLLLGGKISDWDFFAPTQNVSAVVAGDEMMGQLGWQITSDFNNSPAPEYQEYMVRDYIKNGVGKVQIIYSQQKLTDFDISTCQVGLTMQGELRMTPEFEISWRNHYHTVYMKNYRTAHALRIGLLRHLPRILAKYPWSVFMDYKGCDSTHLAKLSEIRDGWF